MNIVRWVKSHGHRRRTSFEAHDGGRWATLVFSGTPSERPSVSDELGETVDCHGVFDSGDLDWHGSLAHVLHRHGSAMREV